ncbi:MAG: ABC transporter permease [Bacteroidota bacterium]|jgi:ABC-type lipoprotein release transport system permease subunit|nr:ABC transporter permease [Bacteroidota bacterium]
MRSLLTLAWRNLWRNTRRTLITITAVVFATWFVIVMRGIQLGTYEHNITFSLNLFSGYAQLQHPLFRDNPSIQKSVHFDARMREMLVGDRRVRGFAPRVYAEGLLSYRDNSVGTAIFGIDPAAERNVTRLAGQLRDGRLLSSADAPEVIVGETMLRNLRARIGDEVVVLAQGYDGSLGNAKYRIVGSVKTGLAEFDRSAVFMGIRTLQELVSLRGRVSVVAVALHDLDDVGEFTTAMNARLDTTAVRALPWEEVMTDLKQGIDLDNYSGILYLGILLIIVAFGILNTVLMSVTERFREFGILLAIGTPQRMLVRLVFIETVMITLIGIAIGNLLGLGVNWYFSVKPIVFTGDFAGMYEEYGFLPIMRAAVRASSFVNSSLSVLVIALLSVLYPLRRVAKLEALKGIRYT